MSLLVCVCVIFEARGQVNNSSSSFFPPVPVQFNLILEAVFVQPRWLPVCTTYIWLFLDVPQLVFSVLWHYQQHVFYQSTVITEERKPVGPSYTNTKTATKQKRPLSISVSVCIDVKRRVLFWGNTMQLWWNSLKASPRCFTWQTGTRSRGEYSKHRKQCWLSWFCFLWLCFTWKLSGVSHVVFQFFPLCDFWPLFCVHLCLLCQSALCVLSLCAPWCLSVRSCVTHQVSISGSSIFHSPPRPLHVVILHIIPIKYTHLIIWCIQRSKAQTQRLTPW